MTLLVVMLAVVLAGLWWQSVKAIDALHHRVRLSIARLMSDGHARSGEEIRGALLAAMRPLGDPPLRWLHLPERALSEMTRQGMLVLSAGRFTAAHHR